MHRCPLPHEPATYRKLVLTPRKEVIMDESSLGPGLDLARFQGRAVGPLRNIASCPSLDISAEVIPSGSGSSGIRHSLGGGGASFFVGSLCCVRTTIPFTVSTATSPLAVAPVNTRPTSFPSNESQMRTIPPGQARPYPAGSVDRKLQEVVHRRWTGHSQ